MRLTLDLPASLRDLARFAAMADDLGIDDTTVPDCDGDALVLDLSERTDEPEPTPTPVKPPRADKRAAKKVEAPAKRKRRNNDLTIELLTIVADAGGTWQGSAVDLARHHSGDNFAAAQKAVTRLTGRALLWFEKINERAVKAIHLTDAGWESIGRTKPTPAPAHPAKTASNVGTVTPLPSKPRQVPPLPEGGIKEPKGGWA